MFSGDYSFTLGYENDFYDYPQGCGFEPDITDRAHARPISAYLLFGVINARGRCAVGFASNEVGPATFLTFFGERDNPIYAALTP